MSVRSNAMTKRHVSESVIKTLSVHLNKEEKDYAKTLPKKAPKTNIIRIFSKEATTQIYTIQPNMKCLFADMKDTGIHLFLT